MCGGWRKAQWLWWWLCDGCLLPRCETQRPRQLHHTFWRFLSLVGTLVWVMIAIADPSPFHDWAVVGSAAIALTRALEVIPAELHAFGCHLGPSGWPLWGLGFGLPLRRFAFGGCPHLTLGPLALNGGPSGSFSSFLVFAFASTGLGQGSFVLFGLESLIDLPCPK